LHDWTTSAWVRRSTTHRSLSEARAVCSGGAKRAGVLLRKKLRRFTSNGALREGSPPRSRQFRRSKTSVLHGGSSGRDGCLEVTLYNCALAFCRGTEGMSWAMLRWAAMPPGSDIKSTAVPRRLQIPEWDNEN